jgi:AcrR family transcriptional regulator
MYFSFEKIKNSCKIIPNGIFLLHENLLSICLVMGKAERTKQFIIEKTATLFNTKGIAATSLQDMTEATGLTKGSIYGNFKNKDEVALEVFRYNFKKVTNLVAEEMARESTFRARFFVTHESILYLMTLGFLWAVV